MAATMIASDRRPWVDAERGVVDRRIFSDPDLYRLELERIFARAWNFVCHESQLPEAGSFFVNWIGEDQVIAVRDRTGKINVLLNSCPHRGNTVCRAELGKTSSFFCSYHGWNFDLDGRLIGMPGQDAFYREAIDKSEWGLANAAQVDSYRGFVFASLDPSAPRLHDYLGWVGRLGIDMTALRGDMEVIDGIHKNRLQCNWKLAVDNLFDWYHVKVSHGSAMRIGFVPEDQMAPMDQMVILGEYGHGIGGPGVTVAQQAEFEARMKSGNGTPQWYDEAASQRMSPAMREQLGPVGTRSYGHPNIFPNLWITQFNQICLRIPRGPFQTELWWFTLLPKEMPAEQRRNLIHMTNHVFGPAGLLEQDDGENWSHSTRGAKGAVTRRRPLNYSMGHGHDRVQVDPSGQSRIETVVNEHGQLWTYRSWQDWMQAESWQELIAHHSLPPSERI